MYFGTQVDPFTASLLQHSGKQAHLELKGQDVSARSATFPAFGDDLFHEEPADWQIYGSDDHQTAVAGQPWKKPSCGPSLPPNGCRPVCTQNQFAEVIFLLREGLRLLGTHQSGLQHSRYACRSYRPRFNTSKPGKSSPATFFSRSTCQSGACVSCVC